MPYAIRIHKTGGPEVLQWEEVAVRRSAAGRSALTQLAQFGGVSFARSRT